MALKEFKGSMLPSAPSSTLTVTSSVPLRCGNFSCRTVRILVLPSGSMSLLMLATDFNLEIVENNCFRNSVPFEVSQGPAPSLWSWKEADSMLCALLVTWLLLDLDCWHLFLPYILWMCCGIVCPLLPTVWIYIGY